MSSEGDRVSKTLHGRRRGKPLSAYQNDLVQTLLPRLVVDASKKIDPTSLFGMGAVPLRLEIGFGAGEHLIAAAARGPDVAFIGCEPFLNGMAHALAALAKANLGNVRLYAGDAGDIVAQLPDACLDRVFLLYPDPWPKRRQRKRRFLSMRMLTDLARVMSKGSALRLATDIDDLSGWMLANLMHSETFEWRAERAADWQQPWGSWSSTRYERKALGQGRRPCYLTAIRR